MTTAEIGHISPCELVGTIASTEKQSLKKLVPASLWPWVQAAYLPAAQMSLPMLGEQTAQNGSQFKGESKCIQETIEGYQSASQMA